MKNRRDKSKWSMGNAVKKAIQKREKNPSFVSVYVELILKPTSHLKIYYTDIFRSYVVKLGPFRFDNN